MLSRVWIPNAMAPTRSLHVDHVRNCCGRKNRFTYATRCTVRAESPHGLFSSCFALSFWPGSPTGLECSSSTKC